MPRKQYTELEKTLICELCKLTNNLRYVTEVSGTHRATILKFLEEKGIEISREYKDIIYKRDISDEELYKRAEAGEEIKDIASSTGLSRSNTSRRIARYRNKFNINKTNYLKNRSDKIDAITAEWIKLIKTNTKTMTQIADETGLSLSGVSRRISRYINRKNGR